MRRLEHRFCSLCVCAYAYAFVFWTLCVSGRVVSTIDELLIRLLWVRLYSTENFS